MKLGRIHLILSFIAMAASMAYVVWSFTGGSAAAVVRPVDDGAPLDRAAPPGPSVAGAAVPIDPTQLTAPPDVALDRLPEWPRNPFAPVPSNEPAAVIDVVEDVPVETEPDLVVTTIMISSTRRVAVVNDRRVSVGDRVGAATIVDIQPDAIVVESPLSGRRTISARRPRSTGGVQ